MNGDAPVRARPRPFSLRKYLLARLLWLILPIVLAVMAVHWYIESRLLRALFDEALEDKAKTLATLVTENKGRFELEFADEYMPEFSRAENPYYFQVWLPDGAPLERSVSLRGRDLPYEFGSLDQPRAFYATLPDGLELRCVGIEFPTRLGTDPAVNAATSVVLVLGAGSGLLQATLLKGYVEVLLTGAIATLGITAVVFLALRRGVRLLERVGTEVERINPSTLQEPLDEELAPAEIRPIVRSLNRSLQVIRGFVERERRFNADVAHELRTPIAELRAAAEVALQWPDDEARGTLAVHAQGIALQMGSLVESLLELARLESVGEASAPEEMDLERFIELQVDQAMREDAGGRKAQVRTSGPLRLASYPALWEVVARNLLGNALIYSPPGSCVEVDLRPDGAGAHLCVANVAEGLDEAEVGRCTERLWRGARAQDAAHHSGLGLSIVEAACARLGHRLSVGLKGGVFSATVSSLEPQRPSARR